MPELPAFEPTSRDQITEWIDAATRRLDPFADIAEATDRHREQHGCDAYPSGDGPLLGVLVAAASPDRILEIGTGLGYSTAWLAHGAPGATIDTMESDIDHIEMARSRIAMAGFIERVSILLGVFPASASGLRPGYGLAVYDAAIPGPEDIDALHGLLRRGGLLVTSNLFLGQYDPEMPGLERGAAARMALLDASRWRTGFAGQKAVSVRA